MVWKLPPGPLDGRDAMACWHNGATGREVRKFLHQSNGALQHEGAADVAAAEAASAANPHTTAQNFHRTQNGSTAMLPPTHQRKQQHYRRDKTTQRRVI